MMPEKGEKAIVNDNQHYRRLSNIEHNVPQEDFLGVWGASSRSPSFLK
jgi:hypothetical protein